MEEWNPYFYDCLSFRGGGGGRAPISKNTSAGIFKQSTGAGNRIGIGLSYRPAGGVDFLELIPGLFKSLKIRVQEPGITNGTESAMLKQPGSFQFQPFSEPQGR
jgi:hypothetical protein